MAALCSGVIVILKWQEFAIETVLRRKERCAVCDVLPVQSTGAV
jgi:hypothetical protein